MSLIKEVDTLLEIECSNLVIANDIIYITKENETGNFEDNYILKLDILNGELYTEEHKTNNTHHTNHKFNIEEFCDYARHYSYFNGIYIDISYKDFLRIGLYIEEKKKILLGESVLGFEKYFSNLFSLMKENYVLPNNICDKSNKFLSGLYLDVLIFYCINPSIDFVYLLLILSSISDTKSLVVLHEYSDSTNFMLPSSYYYESIFNLSNIITSLSDIKINNNLYLARDTNKILNLNKVEIKSIYRSIRYSFPHDVHSNTLALLYETAFVNIFQELINIYTIKYAIKDINNRNKIYNSLYPHNYFYVLESLFYEHLLDRFNETSLINAMCKYDISNLCDICRMYDEVLQKNDDYIIKTKRLRLKEIHDEISIEYKKLNIKNYIYMYNNKTRKHFNRTVNNINFKMVNSTEELTSIGEEIKNCVASYHEDIAKGLSIIISMEKDNRYIGCLEIDNKGNLIQAKGEKNNTLTNGEGLEELLEYINITKISSKECEDIDKKYRVYLKKNNYLHNNYILLKNYFKNEDGDYELLEYMQIYRGAYKDLIELEDYECKEYIKNLNVSEFVAYKDYDFNERLLDNIG